MGKKEPQFCKNKGCKFTSSNKMILNGHMKLRCPFAKKARSSSKREKKTNQLQVDLSEVEIGSHIHTGGYGSVFHGRVGNLRIAIKTAKDGNQKLRNLHSLTVERTVYQQICANKSQNRFPRFVGCLEQKDQTTHIFLEMMDFSLQFLVQTKWDSFNIKEKASIMLQTLMCLKELHQIGFLHRDLKLNNIMVKEGKIYLIDFGGCLYLPGNTKTSIFGSLQFLHHDAHLFRKPIFQHDIQTIGWIFLHLIEEKLPWDSVIKSLKRKEISFHEAAPIVGELKKKFLENEDQQNPFNSFVFQFIRTVMRSEQKEFPKELYAQLRGILMKVILDKGLIGNPYEWKKIRPTKSNEKFGLLVQQKLPEVQMGMFNVFALPQPIITKFKLKEQLTIDYVRLTCSTLGKFTVLDLSEMGQCKLFDKLMDSPNLCLLRSKSDHFAVYVTNGKASFVSFDGMGIMEQLGKWKSFVVWKNVEQQKNDWQSGYRALFWIFEVLRFGSVQNWISNAKL